MLFFKKKKKQKVNSMFLRNWSLRFVIREENEGLQDFVKLITDPAIKAFELVQPCLVTYKTTNSNRDKSTSWVRSFSIIYMEDRTLVQGYRWKEKGFKFVLMVRTERGSRYCLTDRCIDPDFRKKLKQYGFLIG